jgi:methyl-accepting chemotaxis protein
MNFANIKIGGRLSAGFGVVLLLMVSLIAVGLIHLSEIGVTSTKMIDDEWVKAEAVNTIGMMTRANARRTMELLIAPDTAYADKLREGIEANRKAIDTALATLDALVSLPEGKAMLTNIRERRAQYAASFGKVGRLLADNQRDTAGKALISETLPALDALQDNIGELSTLQKHIVEGRGADIRRSIESSRAWMLGLGVASVLLGIGFAYGITRSITGPIGEAVRVAQTVARGNLTSSIVATSTDEAGQLMAALKEMNDSLLKVVVQVRAGTDTIATASSQIASGNLDLSSRTEEQASSLEETASSMEELTATVKQNADNARQGNQLAALASEVALKGGEVVAQVVGTMGAINGSSRKIVDIIGVIDGIAFQTNILALNAAVEAARAGDQGKGFAVVASEVRNLAQRAATAAKEIKALIDDSVEKVDAGAHLVDQAGLTMTAIVDSVKRVADIMTEITAASQEQTSGIEQINQAMSQMDEVTQQNASLVEEAAAAAGALQDQAQRLLQMVSVFQIAPTHNAPVLPLHAAGRPPAPRPVLAGTVAGSVRAPGNRGAAQRSANGGAAAENEWEEF